MKQKLKSKKAAAKRYKFTATGKVKVKRAGMRHNLGNKSSSSKVKKRHGHYMIPGDAAQAARCLPYGTN
jgi:large subunit ribosomal protein L35